MMPRLLPALCVVAAAATACQLQSKDQAKQKGASTTASTEADAQTKAPDAKPSADVPPVIDTTGSPSGVLVRPSDFIAFSNLKKLSEAELVEALWDEPSVILADSAAPGEPVEGCFDKMLAKITSKVVQGTLVFDVNEDAAKCYEAEQQAQDAAGRKTTITTMRVQLRYTVRCEGTDLTAFAGKTMAELDAFSAKPETQPCYKKERFISNSSITTIAMTVTEAAGSYTYASTSKSALMRPDGTACLESDGDNGLETEGDCQAFALTRTSKPTAATTSFFSAKFTGRTSAPGDFHYRTGTAVFQMNDWKGTLTYLGGNQAPAFAATSMAGAKVQGTLAAPGAEPPVEAGALLLHGSTFPPRFSLPRLPHF